LKPIFVSSYFYFFILSKSHPAKQGLKIYIGHLYVYIYTLAKIKNVTYKYTEMEKLILNEIEKQNSREGNVVMMRNLNFNLIQNLNPKEKELFLPAVNNLIDNGLVTYEDGSNGIECLRFTRQGYDKLY
jgi:hypothetical protein